MLPGRTRALGLSKHLSAACLRRELHVWQGSASASASTCAADKKGGGQKSGSDPSGEDGRGQKGDLSKGGPG